MQRVLNVVLAAWAGSLWTVCGIVAPSLFAVLPDRHLAGQVAGYFFRLETWVGLGCGSVAWLLMWRTKRILRADYLLLVTTIVAPLISEIVLHPMLDSARSQADMSRFGMLHGVSVLLFLVACVTALLLVWRANASPKHANDQPGSTMRG
jgi:hypothetical protein